MITKFEDTLEKAKSPEPVYCPECQENMYAPMDKLSILLYRKCLMHELEDYQQSNVMKVAEIL